MQIISSDVGNMLHLGFECFISLSGPLACTTKKKKWEYVRDAWPGVKGSEQEWFYSQNWPHWGMANVVWLEGYCDEVLQDKS